MCHCIRSSPLTHSNFTTRNRRRLRNTDRTTLPPKPPPHLCNSLHIRSTKNLTSHFLTANSGDKMVRFESTTRIKVTQGNYELFDELGQGTEGFEETQKKKKNEEFRGREESVMFLELESGLEKEKRNDGELEDDEVVGLKKDDTVSEEIERFVGRKRRQVIRRSNVIAKQVISVDSALGLGFVSQLWVDTCSWIVLVVEVRPSMLSGEMERFLLEDVYQVGDFVLVEDESVLENDIKMVGLDTLVGYNVVTPSRRSIGKVRGYTFNINSGAVELLELDSFGMSIIPSSLVSTYGLLVEDVLDVESDTVVVHEAATSRVQRLTKGLWETPTVGNSQDITEEYPELERQPIRSDRRQSSRKFTKKVKETEDDWHLPMDYL